MVKTLVLVRHGAPEDAAASGSDMDRRLTAAGSRALRSAYPRTFALLGDDASLAVWSSPAVRALETADVVAQATDAEDIEVHRSLYAQDVSGFLAELDACDLPCVVAVGHAPFVDNVAARFLGTCPPFDKGTAAAIDLPDGTSGRGVLRWYVAGPEVSSWEELAVVEDAVADAADELVESLAAFLDAPESPEALLEFRISLRRVRSLLQFLAPWQTKKQNRRCERAIKELQVASARLRALDILSNTVDGLVESGELGVNSLLPMSCSKERALECSSLLALMRKRHSKKAIRKLAPELSERFGWKSRVMEEGLTADELRRHFDEEFSAVDEGLFGLDLRDGDAVYVARRDTKEMRYVAERLGEVLGPERAEMSEYLDEIQRELGALSDARSNKQLADECAKSPRFRGVRADLGAVARDQAEVVSAITSGLQLLEVGDEEDEADEWDDFDEVEDVEDAEDAGTQAASAGAGAGAASAGTASPEAAAAAPASAPADTATEAAAPGSGAAQAGAAYAVTASDQRDPEE